MENKKIKWIIKEIEYLKNENVINDQVAAGLKEHYYKKLETIKKESGLFFIKVLKFSLILLAALSIIGGIVLLLVNFNWKLITKEMKTAAAFFMLLLPQGIGVYYLIKKKDNDVFRETISLVLSALFGICAAFIGQIYQLSSNGEMFLLVWALSTLAVIYIFKSVSSLALYLVLINALSSVMQINGKVGLVFYLLLILLIPFYIVEYRAKNKIRMKFIDYFMIMSIVSTLGVTLEKNVPGLWMTAYSLLFGILYIYGIIFEEKDDKAAYFLNIKNFFFNPFKVIGTIGTAVMAFMLLFKWPWEDIGWSNYRNLPKFNPIASYFDYALCIIFLLLTVILIVYAFYKKKKFNYALPFFGILVSILYLLNSSLFIQKWFYNYVIGQHAESAATNCLIAAFIGALSVYSYYRVYKKGSRLLMSLIIFYFFASFFALFISKIFELRDESLLSYLFLTGCYFAAAIYMNGVLFYDKYDKDKNRLSVIYRVIGIILSAGFMFFSSDVFFWEAFHNVPSYDKINLIPAAAGIVLLAAGILNAILLFRSKAVNNTALIIFPALIHFLYIIKTAVFYIQKSAAVNVYSDLNTLSSYVVTAYMIFFVMYSYFYGYKNKSAFTVFMSSVFLFVIMLSKFFNWQSGIIVNAVILIVIGITLVLINFFFIKKIRKDEKNEK